MIGSELSIPVITVIAGIFTIVYLLIMFNKNISKARTVRVINTGSLCKPDLADLPVIPDKQCINKKGETVQCYQPDPSQDFTFEIGINPVYYRSVCIRLCSSGSINGSCVDETQDFNSCIQKLEPSPECNASANPLGRLDGTDDIYYAVDVITN
jgi:hypothetical protein